MKPNPTADKQSLDPQEAAERLQFESLQLLIPHSLEGRTWYRGLDLSPIIDEALVFEIDRLAYAHASSNGTFTPTAPQVVAAKNQLRPIITEQFKTLGVVGYVQKREAK